jgi:DNA-binding transcriptional LysR family regulator
MDRARRDDLTAGLSFGPLRTFVRVVETGSMTQAARLLFLAQSGVSTQVSSLASFAGGPLLERQVGRLVPTALGRILYDEARELLSRAAVLERRLHEAVQDRTNSVAVACTRTVCETSVARVVSLFKAAYPEVHLAVASGTVRDVEVRLRVGETDVALVEGNVAIAGARVEIFHTDRLVLAVPAGHALAARASVPFAEAERHPFVLRTTASGTRLLIEQRLGRRFENLEIALELEGNSEVVSCVEAGLGVALLSETALARALALGTVVAVAIEDVDFSRDFYLATPLDRTLAEPARVFATWLTTRYQDARRAALLSA